MHAGAQDMMAYGQPPAMVQHGHMPNMMPGSSVLQPARPGSSNMGGPIPLQIPQPLKKDPFADLF